MRMYNVARDGGLFVVQERMLRLFWVDVYVALPGDHSMTRVAFENYTDALTAVAELRAWESGAVNAGDCPVLGKLLGAR